MDVFIYRVVKLYFKQKNNWGVVMLQKNFAHQIYRYISKNKQHLLWNSKHYDYRLSYIWTTNSFFSLSLWIVIIYLTASASSFVHNTINFIPVHAAKNMKYNFEFSFNKEWIEIVQKGDSKIFGINIKRIIWIHIYIAHNESEKQWTK